MRRSAAISIASILFLITLILLSSVTKSASAVTMETVINPNGNTALLSYEELHIVTANYSTGSHLASVLGSSNKLVVSSSTNDTRKDNQQAMQNLIASINAQLRKQNSVATARSSDIKVTTEIKPASNTSTIIEQQILMNLTIDNYVIPNNQDPAHKYIDFNWRSFAVNDPLKITYVDNKTKVEKSVEINMMSDAIENAAPGFNDALKADGAGANEIAFLQRPIIDFSKLSLSMDKWYVLFDAAASLRETEAYGYAGEINGAKAVTIYSLGEGSIREGKHDDTIYNTSFGKNNEFSLQFKIPAPNSRIDVLGYSNMHSKDGQDTAVISDKNEGGSSYAGNFPFVVLGGFGAIIAVIVGFVLFKARTPKISE